MRNLLTSLIISLAVVAIASPSYAGDDREDNKWDRDKKEEHNHSKKEEHGKKGRHRKGGLPRCEAELAECLINLTETETQLQVCEDELAQCKATEGQAFPATGQTSCWDTDGNPIDCAGTGHDGDIQAGADLSYTDTGLTIIDNNTKLEWMKLDDNNGDCGSYPGYLDKDCVFTWDEAFTFVASLNLANHVGHDDWRVPNVRELVSIVNYENALPSASTEFNTGCVSDCTLDICSCTASLYWSSTSDAFEPSYAWFVGFGDGDATNLEKSDDAHVRAVRGGL